MCGLGIFDLAVLIKLDLFGSGREGKKNAKSSVGNDEVIIGGADNDGEILI